jgi:hypothetical protein
LTISLAELYDGPVEYCVIATKGKGESLARPELELIEAAYRSGKYDLFVFDDLSRLIRGGKAAELLGIGVDNGTRTICVNDEIDTAKETWEQDALAACSENVRHNESTSRRIKQKCMNRFIKLGATADRSITGYIVPDGVKSFNGWLKDLSLEIHIREGAIILRATLNGEAVARYFNAHGVPVGPHCRAKEWNGTMVLRFYRNPLLKGMPQRGRMATEKHHGTGKRRSRKNPKGPSYFHAPHLAFFTEAEFDELVVLLAKKNAKFERKKIDGKDARLNVPRRRTRSFGQHARCWYCGRHYVWGGNGIQGNLMCSGSRERKCWNSIGFPGALAAKKIVQVITERLSALEGLDDQFREMVSLADRGGANGTAAQWEKVQRDEAGLARDREKVKQLVLSAGSTSLLSEMVKELDDREKLLAGKRRALQVVKDRTLNLPKSASELHLLLQQEFERLSIDSFDFGDLLRQLVPEMYVYLVRQCDGGHLLSRAKLRLNLLGGFTDNELAPELSQLLSSQVTIDLFVPPQRARIRDEVVRLASQGLEQRQIASRLAENPTQTAVWKALELQRRMDALDLADPFIRISEPPSSYPKLRRHKHPQYRFEPLDDYQAPEL